MANKQTRHILNHFLIDYIETIPNSKKLQTTTEMWLLKDFKICIAWKHCGKRWNCSFWAISPFSSVFLKLLFFNVLKWVYMEERVKHESWDKTVWFKSFSSFQTAFWKSFFHRIAKMWDWGVQGGAKCSYHSDILHWTSQQHILHLNKVHWLGYRCHLQDSGIDIYSWNRRFCCCKLKWKLTMNECCFMADGQLWSFGMQIWIINVEFVNWKRFEYISNSKELNKKGW